MKQQIVLIIFGSAAMYSMSMQMCMASEGREVLSMEEKKKANKPKSLSFREKVALSEQEEKKQVLTKVASEPLLRGAEVALPGTEKNLGKSQMKKSASESKLRSLQSTTELPVLTLEEQSKLNKTFAEEKKVSSSRSLKSLLTTPPPAQESKGNQSETVKMAPVLTAVYEGTGKQPTDKKDIDRIVDAIMDIDLSKLSPKDQMQLQKQLTVIADKYDDLKIDAGLEYVQTMSEVNKTNEAIAAKAADQISGIVTWMKGKIALNQIEATIPGTTEPLQRALEAQFPPAIEISTSLNKIINKKDTLHEEQRQQFRSVLDLIDQAYKKNVDSAQANFLDAAEGEERRQASEELKKARAQRDAVLDITVKARQQLLVQVSKGFQLY
ncbi:MAG: hypothetical protein WCE21_02090 [Candidatus Babeliales bacterium]